MSDSERIAQLEEQVREQNKMLAEMMPVIDALGSLLVRRRTVNARVGLNKNTLAQNKNIDKFEALGQGGTLIELKDVAVIKKRMKNTVKRSR